MTDNFNPGYSNPIIDYPNKEEITEKPYYDDTSAPAPQNNLNQNHANYNYQPPNYSNNNYNMQNNQNMPNYYPYNDQGIEYNYANPVVPPSLPQQTSMTNNPKRLMILSILILVFAFIDLLIQAICGFFSPFLLADDIALIIMGIIFLVLTCKKKSTKSCPLGAATVFVWFVGFGCKGFGMIQIGIPAIIIIDFFLLIGRTISIFLCIPFTCG